MSTEITLETKTAETTEPTRSGQFYRPDIDIVEQSNELLLLADMPGAKANEIEIDFKDGMLTLHGRVKPRQADGTCYLLNEYGTGDFYRTFQVSEQIDASRIQADFRDGVLTLRLPKTEAAKPRKISIEIGKA